MSTRAKIFTAIGIILFVCLIVWVVRTTPDTPPPIKNVAPPTVMEYEGNTITEEKDGKIIWELTSEKMRIDSVTQNIELDGVTAKFYQHDDEKSWTLTADKGIYYDSDSIIHVEGNVKVTNSDGAELTSDQLEWLGEEDTLAAIGNVKISKDDMRAYGDIAYSDNGFRHFGLLGHAKVLKGVKDDTPTDTDNH